MLLASSSSHPSKLRRTLNLLRSRNQAPDRNGDQIALARLYHLTGVLFLAPSVHNNVRAKKRSTAEYARRDGDEEAGSFDQTALEFAPISFWDCPLSWTVVFPGARGCAQSQAVPHMTQALVQPTSDEAARDWHGLGECWSPGQGPRQVICRCRHAGGS